MHKAHWQELLILLDSAQFYPDACSSTPDAFVQASLGTCSHSRRLLCRAAHSADWLLASALPCAKGAGGALMLSPTAIHLALYCRGWPALLWWPPHVCEERGKRGEEVALLQANYPLARQAHGFTSTGNSSGGEGGHGWVILGGMLSRTSFPQLSGLQPCAGPRSPLGTVDLCTCKMGELAYTTQMKN